LWISGNRPVESKVESNDDKEVKIRTRC